MGRVCTLRRMMTRTTIKLGAPLLSLLLMLSLAACAHHQTVAELLSTPAGQADPLGTLSRAGYTQRSDVYQATVIVLNQGMSPTSPAFPATVNRQIRMFAQSEEMGMQNKN